ncbi:hypothetical protein MIND_00534200 [Mycena indigotica]|uniref:Uncharacterized protein n=1 Tax=Mycena indigotica TaxID=2126181 RepID=A0A8H6SW98_9AGAR|nr:uncharacterized protein MIND_00534200 [Mycena indigotica]KAF7307400.1 hypothetical protein MIND_00534200 [Mycena indigotica]
MSVQISSPKAPRSSHHRRSSSTRSSPRQNRVRSYPSPRSPTTPPESEFVAASPFRATDNYAGPSTPGFVPENLHVADETFDIDPTTGVLDAAGETYQPPIPPAGRNRFVGGFVGGIKKAWWQRGRPPADLEESVPYPEPAIIHDGETQYEALSPEERYGHEAHTPYPEQQYLEDIHEETVEDHRPSHERKESSTSTDTMHQNYEGTTIVNHEPFQNQYGSPQFYEPQPGPDYAKISPPRSEASLGSYIARVQRFIKAINDLPWISSDRVTVDYIPRGAREQMALESAMGSSIGSPRPRPRSRVGRRTTVSWYNSNQPPGSVDLLAGSTPLDEFGQPIMPKEIPLSFAPQSPATQYPYTSPGAGLVYGNNSPIPVPQSPQRSPPPMAGALGPNTPKGTPRRVPPPRYDPDIDGPPGSGTYRLPGSPRYAMGGYVPYEQLGPGQAYTASTISSVSPSTRG